MRKIAPREGKNRGALHHDPSALRKPEAVLDALRKITVCDPACGSGAYLLGMLHELMDLRDSLFVKHRIGAEEAYDRKLEIIQNNLYGVDKDPFAISIACLRLWLSLAVEFEGDNPPALPNLDYKIEAGDSLIAPDPSGGLEQGFRKTLIDEFRTKKAEYLMAHGGRKATLKDQICELQETITGWAHGKGAVHGFDRSVMFAEIFLHHGFDVVLANPPYVRADAQFKHLENENERQQAISDWKEFRTTLLRSRVYSTLYEKWDLYVPFLERGFQLLRPGGRLVFIISDAYNAAKYAAKSQRFFVENTRIERIDFCTDIPLFAAGVSNTILHFAKSTLDQNYHPIRARRWGDNRDQFQDNVELLPSEPQGEFGVALFRSDGQKQEQEKSTEGFIPLDRACFISVGMVINANERGYLGAFAAEDLLSTRRDERHPKRFAFGKDIEKWHLRNLRYLEWNTNRAPRRFRRPTFPELHEAPEKLVAVRTPGSCPKVLFDGIQMIRDHGGAFVSDVVGLGKTYIGAAVLKHFVRTQGRSR